MVVVVTRFNDKDIKYGRMPSRSTMFLPPLRNLNIEKYKLATGQIKYGRMPSRSTMISSPFRNLNIINYSLATRQINMVECLAGPQ